MLEKNRHHVHVPDRVQAGFSLIEIIFALSIAGIVLMGAYMFSKNAAEANAATKGREAALKTNQSILTLLKRDYDFQNNYDATKGRFLFSINRKDSYKKGAALTSYNVSYSNVCRPIKGSNTAKVNSLKAIYAKDNLATFAKLPGHCLADLKCKPGTFPQVQIAHDASSATYPNVEFPVSSPDASALTGNQSIGSAACFDIVNSLVHVFVESIYISNPSKSGITVLTDESILSSSGFNNVEVLPK